MTSVRLIVVTQNQALISAIQHGLQGKPNIEMIITVNAPEDAENKLSRKTHNVILLDLDAGINALAFTWAAACCARFQGTLLCVAESTATRADFPAHVGDDFLLKPTTFTKAAGDSFAAALNKQLENVLSRMAPLPLRELNKTIPTRGANPKVIVVASSTGGTNALEDILKALPAQVPPILIVQHMPSGFTKLFADRLDNLYKQHIREAQTGDLLMQGQVLIAPADKHMRLMHKDGRLAVECFVGTKIHGVMPAADVLFESAANLLKANAVGVVLTGMGADGAKGLMLMHNAGAKTIGQNEATCIVYGMPKVAKSLGAVDYELPLGQIAEKMLFLATSG